MGMPTLADYNSAHAPALPSSWYQGARVSMAGVFLSLPEGDFMSQSYRAVNDA